MNEEEFWSWVEDDPKGVGLALQEATRVLAELIAGIDRCMPAWDGALVMAQMHSQNYTPEQISIAQELEAARALLAEP